MHLIEMPIAYLKQLIALLIAQIKALNYPFLHSAPLPALLKLTFAVRSQD